MNNQASGGTPPSGLGCLLLLLVVGVGWFACPEYSSCVEARERERARVADEEWRKELDRRRREQWAEDHRRALERRAQGSNQQGERQSKGDQTPTRLPLDETRTGPCGLKERRAARLTLDAAAAFNAGRSGDKQLTELALLLQGDRDLTDLLDHLLGAIRHPGTATGSTLMADRIASRMGARGRCVLDLIEGMAR